MSDTLGNPLTEAEVMPNGFGIVRPHCTFVPAWNAHRCDESLTYRMLVVENLDSDREIRRLSPVAVSADGYTDLLNENQDHGWCLSYTCLKRLATYPAVVATGREYTIHLTGSNPVETQLHLLHAANDESMIVNFYYTGGSRLQVFVDDQYIEDLNMVDGKRKALMFKQGLIGANDGAGGWQDEPVLLSHAHGTNSYDRTTKMISVVIRGDRPLKIVQMPVVSVGMSLAVSETEFWAMETTFISSIAAMLGIPASRIVVTDIVADSGTRRLRWRSLAASSVNVNFEITPTAQVDLPQAAPADGLESDAFIAVTITRSVNVLSKVTVRYYSEDGTATAGVHYSTINGTVTFAETEVTKVVQVPLLLVEGHDGTMPRRTLSVNIESLDAGVGTAQVELGVLDVHPPAPTKPVRQSLPTRDQLSVQWTAPVWPSPPPGVAVASFEVQRRAHGASDWASAVTSTVTNLDSPGVLASQLDTYSAWEFRVRAASTAGQWSAWSPTSDMLRTASVCGDRRRHGNEDCDDGNVVPGDGCNSVCRIEPGFSCSGGELGGTDSCSSGCGDGLRVGGEACDTGATPSAGCKACIVARGWACVGGSSSTSDTCSTTCNDGVRGMGAEACDDGGAAGGCKSDCSGVEAGWECSEDATGLSVCSNCGNGILEADETCDDAGAAGGCASDCSAVAAGWVCTRASAASADVCVGGPVVPLAPTATLVEADSITWSWAAVAGNGLSVSSYTLEYEDSVAPGVWVTTEPASVAGTKIKVSGLRSLASYRARVAASSSAGTSAFGTISASVTTLDDTEVVELESDSAATDELGGIIDDLVSSAATSSYLEDLGVGNFDLVPPPPPPVIPLEDDGSLSDDEAAELLGDTVLDGEDDGESEGSDATDESSGSVFDTIEIPDGVNLGASTTTGSGSVAIGAGSFEFALASVKVGEAAGHVNITVKRINGAFGTASVSYATQDGTAKAGTAYTSTQGSLTFAAGQLRTWVIVPIIDDTLFGSSTPKFTMVLSNPTNGATLGSKSTITVSVLENDSAMVVSFAAGSVTVSEDAGSVTLSMIRQDTASASTTITYTISVKAGVDAATVHSATVLTGVITVPVGGATLVVPIVDSHTSVAPATARTFTVTLSPGATSVVGSQVSVKTTLAHSDCRPRGACAVAQPCGQPSHCNSTVCTGAGVCASTATCDDGAANGGETCVDGGGVCTARCARGEGCSDSFDCLVGDVCVAGNCTAPAATCECGAQCSSKCAEAASCSQHDDCAKGVCDATGTCNAPYSVSGTFALVGYTRAELTERHIEFLRRAVAQYLGVPISAVHLILSDGSAVSRRRALAARDSSVQATVTYKVYTSDRTTADAVSSAMAPTAASALHRVITTHGLNPVSISATEPTVAAENTALEPDSGSGVLLIVIIVVAVVAVAAFAVTVYCACFRGKGSRRGSNVSPEPTKVAVAKAAPVKDVDMSLPKVQLAPQGKQSRRQLGPVGPSGAGRRALPRRSPRSGAKPVLSPVRAVDPSAPLATRAQEEWNYYSNPLPNARVNQTGQGGTQPQP